MQDKIISLLETLSSRIIGQQKLLERLLIAVFADGHIIVEGAPGLAKTMTIRLLSELIDCTFQRIQFTPDLLPSDITGNEIYRPAKESFEFIPGPIFHNLILADEINRAPAKVQSALLEAMGERQITVSNKTYELSEIFFVMATQNPIEQEGTYNLPEAQLDRFMLYVLLQYPTLENELKILKCSNLVLTDVKPMLSIPDIKTIRKEIDKVYIDERLLLYIAELVTATRGNCKDDDVNQFISIGAGPRASIALEKCSRCLAYIRGQDSVTPDIIQELVFDILAHRLILSFEAQSANVDKEQVIEKIIKSVSLN